jgi:hypothetical protein
VCIVARRIEWLPFQLMLFCLARKTIYSSMGRCPMLVLKTAVKGSGTSTSGHLVDIIIPYGREGHHGRWNDHTGTRSDRYDCGLDDRVLYSKESGGTSSIQRTASAT